MTIEILNYKKLEKGSLLGFVDFYVPKMGLEIFGSSIHQKDGRRWLNLPSKEYKDKDTSETKWSSVIRFREREHQNAFSKAVLDSLNAWIVKNSNEQTINNDQGVPF